MAFLMQVYFDRKWLEEELNKTIGGWINPSGDKNVE